MLVSRDDMTFDFGGAGFELDRDRDVLGWIFSQLLFREVKGFQVGRWIETAPTFSAAQFLARQASEEMAHAKVLLKILESLGVPARPPHRALRLLTSSVTGATFPEHVFLETAVGKGFGLIVDYGLIDTLPESRARTLLAGLARQEEGHVAFGEQQTIEHLAADGGESKHLLGLAIVALAAISRLGSPRGGRFVNHPVLGQLPAFVRHAERVTELRLRRLGVLPRPLAQVAVSERVLLGVGALVRHYGRVVNPLRSRPTRIPASYLDDPAIKKR